MKREILLTILVIITSVNAFAQSLNNNTPNLPGTNANTQTANDNWTDRICFIVGLGFSGVTNTSYQDITVNKVDNSVIIEKSDRLKTSITLGLLYSFWNYQSTDSKGNKFLYAAGPSFGIFFNPINITSINATKASPLDLGIGIGWKFQKCAILLTYDCFSARQPKDYFVQEFQGNNKQYIINTQVQSSIDVNDNSIYRNKMLSAIGVKFLFPINIIKTYFSSTNGS